MIFTLAVLFTAVVAVIVFRAYKSGTIELTPATTRTVRACADRIRHHGRRFRAWSRTGATWAPPHPDAICADHTDDRPVAARLAASEKNVAGLAARIARIESAFVELERVVDDLAWPEDRPDPMTESDRSDDRSTEGTADSRDGTYYVPASDPGVSDWPNDRPGGRTRPDPLAIRVDDAIRVAGPSGVTSAELADRFGVSDRQVRRVLEEIGAHRRGHRRVHPDYVARTS